MQDVNSEILKLKALINNKQNTSVFANKANDCTQLVHDGYKLYVNDMTKKFTFTTANTQNPITIDTRTHAIDNVEYIDDLKISDLKGLKQQLDDEIEARIAGDEALDEAKADVDHTHEISDVSGLQTALDNKASTNHTHTDINYEITFRDLLTFKDDGKLRWHITDAEFLNGHVSGTLVQKFQIGTEKLVVYDTVSVWNRLTADNITLGLNNGQDLGTLISTKADESMLTALAARVAIVETGKADVNHTHNDYVKTSFNNYDEDPSDNIYFESWFPQGYDTFLKLEERTKDNSYSDATTLKPQFIEFCHNDITNDTQKFATYGVDGIEFTNGETIQQGTIDNKISTAISNHNHDSIYVKPADLTAAINAAKTAILQQIYPVGAIYTSRTKTNPATVLGFGTWTSIQNQFMYCIPTNTAHSTGGSSTHKHTTGNFTLKVEHIPPHNHTIQFDGWHYCQGNSYNAGAISRASHNDSTQSGPIWTVNTGGGQAHNHGNTGDGSSMPPYITVYAWYRSA